MAKYKRKIETKIDRRHRGYDEACRIAEHRQTGSSKGYTRPGSRKLSKQG